MRYLIKISYDGTEFIGWQKQRQGRSVQSVMEKVLEAFGVNPPNLTCAGRTDAGVHALGQYAHFEYDGRMGMKQMLKAFRRWLPHDIKVLQIWQVGDDLSARFQAYERHYRYVLTTDLSPFERNFAAFLPHLKLRLQPMQAAAVRLLGRHDFSSFGRLNPEVPNHICEIKEIDISLQGNSFIFTLRADRFLHHMVRRIVGTLAYISHFDLPADTIDKILAGECPRQNLVFTAPAEGLFLIGVKYPPHLLDGRASSKYSDIKRR